MAKLRNQLSMQETVALVNYLTERQAYFAGMPQARIAAEASEELSFRVTVANVRQVIQTFNLDIPTSRQRGQDPCSVQKLRERIAELENRTAELENIVQQLSIQLDTINLDLYGDSDA